MTMPREAAGRPGVFDRFADWVARFTSQSVFFAACVALVVGWAPTYLLVRNFDSYQLIINTPTTIITFLLVALLQNTQTRADDAVQHKLNAIASYLLDPEQQRDELEAAVGLEKHETSGG
jgi:low affinity Fe/Cu permease